MRTDVKVGLVCVLILVIAVVAYFALQGKGKEAPAAANNHNTPKVAKTEEPASGPASPPMATPPVGYTQAPIVPAPAAQNPAPYSPPTSPMASTTEPVTGLPLNPAGPHPLLPPAANVPPLTNNGSTGGLTEPGAPTGPVIPSTPATPSLGSEEHPGELPPSHDDSMLVPGSTMPPAAHSHGLAPYPPLTNGGSTAGDYTVVSGDNLTRIAKKNHTTVAALKAANPGINPDKLKVKQVLKLPEAGAGETGAGETPTAPATTRPGDSSARSGAHRGAASTGTGHSSTARPASAASGTYRVKKGDTLRKIAKSIYGNESLWRRIFRMNRGELANPNDLTPGMALKIPAK